MQYIPQIVFVLLLAVAIGLFAKRVKFIRRNIFLGKQDQKRNDRKGERLKQMVLFALGQKKMFKKPIPAIFHFLIYVGFILINLELIEIVLDGILGTHRLLAEPLGGFYPVLISFLEVLAVLVFIACVVFLWRRNVMKISRFEKREMKGWPKLDANLILVFEIILVGALIFMNAADLALQQHEAAHYVQTGAFLVSEPLSALFAGMDTQVLAAVERSLWWIHIAGILFFLNYVTYSKHLHIILAFPNSYYADMHKSDGKMENMPAIQNEVNMMLNPDAAGDPNDMPPPPDHFGAKDVTDLGWKNILDAYSCTECGRCTAECPQNMTGKLLSPRKIMMDTRDRVEELGRAKDAKGADHHDGKSLIDDYITTEELQACNTCNACVEACPVNINPLDIILQLRRHQIMDQAKSPNEWNVMFGNVENNMAPWQFSPDDRFKWANDVETNEKEQ